MNRSLLMLTIVFVLIFSASAALAASPGLINYQGYLTNPAGEPITGVMDMEFSLWSDKTSTNAIYLEWNETWTAATSQVTVEDGYFTALLGSFIAMGNIFEDNMNLWLEIEVGGSTLTPRKQVGGAAYGFVADVADDISFQISTAQIADYAVTGIKLATDSVTADKIATGAVGASEIATNAVGAAEIAAGAVGTSEIADNSVGIADIGSNAVDTDELVDYSVTTNIIENLAVTNGKLATDAVSTIKIQNGAITASKIDTPLSLSDSDGNGGVVTVENTAAGSAGNYPAGLMGMATGAPGSYKAIGVLGDYPQMGGTGGAPNSLLPNGGIGVAGASTTGPGVAGVSTSGDGVYGNSVSDNGVYGETASTTYTEGGVKGVNSSSGNGVYGYSITGYGVRGGSEGNIAIYGNSVGGSGVVGQTSFAGASGVRGYTYSNDAIAVSGRGYNYATAGDFQSTYGFGVYAHTGGTGLNAAALKAESTANGVALYAINSYASSTDAAAVLSNTGSGMIVKGFGGDGGEHEFSVSNNGSVWSKGSIAADGNIQSDGAIYTGASAPTVYYGGSPYYTGTGDIGTEDDMMVDDDIIVGNNAYIDGTLYGGKGGLATMIEQGGSVRTYHVEESTQNMLSDRGNGKLAYGETTIMLRSAYADAIRVDQSHPLMVQLTPTADCNGLYVSSTTKDSFTVRELGDGDSLATFDWEVAAQQKSGMEGWMPKVSEALATQKID